MDVKFPDVTVKLVGTNSNSFALMASVNAALRKAGYGSAISGFMDEAMSGDYDNLLRVCMTYVNVE